MNPNNLSKIILEMGNRQIQEFLRHLTGTELSHILYHLTESAQDKIYNNMAIRAVSHLQGLLETLRAQDNIPEINPEVLDKLEACHQKFYPVEIPVLPASYTIQQMIDYLCSLKDFVSQNGTTRLNEILDNCQSETLKKLILRLSFYDNIIEFEDFMNNLLKKRIDEISIENKIISHSFTQIFSGEFRHLKSELINLVPFMDQSVKEELIVEQKTILDGKNKDTTPS